MIRLIVYRTEPLGGVEGVVVLGVLAGDSAITLPDDRRYLVDAEGPLADQLAGAIAAGIRGPIKGGDGLGLSALARILGDAEVETP